MIQNSNKDMDEKRIKRLYSEMRQQDEAATPSFIRLLQRPGSGSLSLAWSSILRFGAVAAVLILIFSLAIILLRHKSSSVVSGDKPQKPRVVDQSSSVPIPSVVEPEKPRPVVYKPKKRTVRKSRSLISQWKSPTDFLLRTPGNELFKTVPRLIDPTLKFNAIIPNEKN